MLKLGGWTIISLPSVSRAPACTASRAMGDVAFFILRLQWSFSLLSASWHVADRFLVSCLLVKLLAGPTPRLLEHWEVQLSSVVAAGSQPWRTNGDSPSFSRFR